MKGGHQKCPLLSCGHLFHAKFREMNMIRHNGTYTNHHKRFGQYIRYLLLSFYYEIQNPFKFKKKIRDTHIQRCYQFI